MAYFSNGSEGMILDNQCVECLHSNPNTACPIYFASMEFNYDQCSDGQEKLRECLNMLVSEKGICKMREQLEKAIPDFEKWVESLEDMEIKQ